jgi:large subunit ribosomal protein L21
MGVSSAVGMSIPHHHAHPRQCSDAPPDNKPNNKINAGWRRILARRPRAVRIAKRVVRSKSTQQAGTRFEQSAVTAERMKTMFAIIENGGRQYRVEPGDTLQIDYQSETEQGGELVFDRVLLANGGESSVIGTPLIEGAAVTAEVVTPLKKGKKIEVGIYRRRKNSRRHIGHRQKYTMVKINAIDVPGLKTAEETEAADEKPKAKPTAKPVARPVQEPAAEKTASGEEE